MGGFLVLGVSGGVLGFEFVVWCMVVHEMEVRSKQLFTAYVYSDAVDENRERLNQSLEFDRELSLVFECSCGEMFYKEERALEHLKEV